ncbi:MAG TPA: arylsulfatase [Acidimicrobiales bacterium]
MEPEEFEGTIGRYWWESTPWWPPEPGPPPSAPNVLIVLLDDVGFAQLGCFGSDIDTPAMDALAGSGLRYRNFHTTALCSPTRACLLSGRNHHTMGVGRIIELAAGFPGYDSRLPASCRLLPRMLTAHGYAAYAVGKWHLTPEEEAHLAAPRDRWPLGVGFERFYGFINGGETHQNVPALVHDNHFVSPPRSMEDGYHLTEDLADRTIEFIDDLRNVTPDKPFFLYLATGACHSPHQAPAEFIERYRGAFDDGWDVWRERTFARQKELGVIPDHAELSERPEWVPAWADLSDKERTVYARFMECFAGMLTHTDHHLGRVVEHLRRTGELDNTLIMVMSDNGASSEGGPVGSLNDVRIWNGVAQTVDEAFERLDEVGGPRIHNNYPWGWTVAGNTPFRRWKREVHEGGVADPLLVHWPAGITGPGEVRGQYVHVIDVVPTVLEVIGIDPPTHVDGVDQRPIEGTSFAPTLGDAGAADVHTTQYYEMFGCRAIYHQGWKAVVYHQIQSHEPGLDRVRWELYDLRSDPTECHDLASLHPDKLAEMEALWWAQADQHQVLPIDNRPLSSFVHGRPTGPRPRSRYVYRPHRAAVPEHVAVSVKHRPHVVRASVDIPAGGADGVLIAQGSVLGGWALYLLDGRLRYVHNVSGRSQHHLGAAEPVSVGRHDLGMRYVMDGNGGDPATVELTVDGAVVVAGPMPEFTWHRFSLTGAGLTCGRATAPAVSDEFVAPFTFGGTLYEVVVEVEGAPALDPLVEALDAVTTQ